MPAKDIKNMADHLNFISEDLEEETISRMVSCPVPASGKNRIICLTPEQLVEYTDEEFQTATGRPQPFHEYDGEEFKSLVESVKENGILEPVIVRPFHGKYQILAGRHRTRAAKIAGKPIPCLIREDADDIEAAKIMIDTNLEQRSARSFVRIFRSAQKNCLSGGVRDIRQFVPEPTIRSPFI